MKRSTVNFKLVSSKLLVLDTQERFWLKKLYWICGKIVPINHNHFRNPDLNHTITYRVLFIYYHVVFYLCLIV